MKELLSEGPELASLIGYQLQRVNLGHLAAANAALAQHDITPARFSALMIVRENPGCTQSALGKALDVNRASAMKIVNYLEARGLVERQEGEDTRANALYVTSEASKLVPKILKILHDVDENFLSQLSAKDRKNFLSALVALREARKSQE